MDGEDGAKQTRARNETFIVDVLDSVVLALLCAHRRCTCGSRCALLLSIVAFLTIVLLLDLVTFRQCLFILCVLEEELVGSGFGTSFALCLPEFERRQARASATGEVDFLCRK